MKEIPTNQPNLSPQSPQNSSERKEQSPLVPNQSLEQTEPTKEIIRPSNELGPSPPPVITKDDQDDTAKVNNESVPSVPRKKEIDASTETVAQPQIKIEEKEWVNKAKKIVEETKDDPYMQEEKVSQLQADYLKEMYGKVVKPDQ